MLDYLFKQEESTTFVYLKGRIDGITSPELQSAFSKSILEGNRLFVLDLAEVNYVSSVGIRVFMSLRKELDSAGGKMAFLGVTPSIKEIFKISGFLRIFQFVNDISELNFTAGTAKSVSNVIEKESNEFKFKIKENPNVTKGTFSAIGKMEPFLTSDYSDSDVVKIGNNIEFGLGLATAGDNFNDFNKFFGDSLLINNNLFWYPAVKNPTVDYMISSENSFNKQFLNGMGFSGKFSKIIFAESKNESSEIGNFFSEIASMIDSTVFCIVMIFESKGLWGMNIKKVPFGENKPQNNNDDIFDEKNFAEWFNFPMEPEWNHHLVAGAAVYNKTKSQYPKLKNFFPNNTNFHTHCVVYERGFMNNDINLFEKEVNRITTELNPLRVFHLLGNSSFKKVMAGIIIPEIK